MIEIDLLHILSSREAYTKYRKFVKDHALTTEVSTLLKDMGVYFDTYPDTEIDWNKFGTWFKLVRHPGFKEEQAKIYTAVFSKLVAHTGGELVDDVISHYIALDHVGKLLDIGNRIVDGDPAASMEKIKDVVDAYYTTVGTTKETAKAVTDDLSELLTACVATGGLEWRLEELNVCIGPVRFGDMIIVGARPETGKTTFITSELTHFAGQIKDGRPILIFNNEEQGNKIRLRTYQSALGLTLPDFLGNESKWMAEYEKVVGSKDRIRVFDVHGYSISELEQLVKEQNPCVVVFNVFDPDKIDVGHGDNQAAVNKKLAAWGRQLGIKYGCLVFGIVQADGSAEGQQWINQSQLYGSKTGLQGEADAIITIGTNPANPIARYIHAPKNKLPGGPRTDPKEKHGFFEVEFDGERGRYVSGVKYRRK